MNIHIHSLEKSWKWSAPPVCRGQISPFQGHTLHFHDDFTDMYLYQHRVWQQTSRDAWPPGRLFLNLTALAEIVTRRFFTARFFDGSGCGKGHDMTQQKTGCFPHGEPKMFQGFSARFPAQTRLTADGIFVFHRYTKGAQPVRP